MSQRYQAAILSASFNGLKAPDAPTIGTATAGSGSASVTFTAPSNVGGGAITSYTVISSPGSILGTGASSPVTVSGLTNGTAYTFTVVATNAYGSGPASAASNSVTPAVNYIESVFSTYLYTGNSSTQTITNGIDLSTKGGLVWSKVRNTSFIHNLFDTVRGVQKTLCTNTTDAEATESQGLTAFNSNGYTTGPWSQINSSSGSFVSWTFREQAKFFDIVTWSGDSTSGRQIAHNLGSTPGMVIIKSLVVDNWCVWHRSLTAGNYIVLNSTAAQTTSGAVNRYGNGTTTVDPTSTYITVGSNGEVNQTGNNYVAYLFAHDAGGFGLSGSDNVISCGSCVSDASGYIQPVNLGYEPQWVMLKRTNSAANWVMMDTMRGMANTAAAASPILLANTSAAEAATGVQVNPTATGFEDTLWGGWGASNTYIYIAIRRGPMKVPTSGTSVFVPVAYTGTGAAGQTLTGASFPPDLSIFQNRPGFGGAVGQFVDRLRGGTAYLPPSSTAAEGNAAGYNIRSFNMDGITYGTSYVDYNYNGSTYINWMMRRAPSFFDEVCYLGNGSTQTITHNLGVVPELIIGKNRTTAGNNWPVLFNFASTTMNYGFLNLTNSCPNDTYANVGVFSAAPTSTSMFLVNSGSMNTNTNGQVAYLFATCAGVSKVGSYTGTGALLTLDCGFTTGARFVLIKRTDSTGDWYTYDSARGITSGNDPYLFLNSTAAEVTGTNYVDTTGVGFQVTAAAPAALNAVGGNYIFLAIA